MSDNSKKIALVGGLALAGLSAYFYFNSSSKKSSEK